jgi:hypothetical protein
MPMSEENEPLGSPASPTKRRIDCAPGVALGSVGTALGLGLVDEGDAGGVDTDGSGAETGRDPHPIRNDAASTSALGPALIGEL